MNSDLNNRSIYNSTWYWKKSGSENQHLPQTIDGPDHQSPCPGLPPTPPPPPPPPRHTPLRDPTNLTTVFPWLFHDHFLIFHDHLSSRFCIHSVLRKNVCKWGLSTSMVNFLVVAKDTCNTILVQFEGKIGEIPWLITKFINFPWPFSFSRFSSLCGNPAHQPRTPSAVFGLPLVLVLSLAVGPQLVAHTAQHAGGGLGGDDDGLQDGGRDLAEHAAHRPRHALQLVLLYSHLGYVTRCTRDSLRETINRDTSTYFRRGSHGIAQNK